MATKRGSKIIETAVEGFTLRFAEPSDVPLILRFIQDLAEYERLAHECIATEDTLRDTLFAERPYAEVLLGSFERTATGFALFYTSYSTFLARPGIYLEDLFVQPEWRGRGFGRALLEQVARIAVERDRGRLEWAVLDWNVDAIRFYERLGAVPLDDWTTMRLAGENLQRLGRQVDSRGQ